MVLFGQEIYINPAKGRKFNVDDFAGLLARYEADVKVQYMHLNSDLQYCVTVTRAKLKDAFVSWSTLENFIDGMTQSLYNGAYIDEFALTKELVSSAYASNQVDIETVTLPNTADLADTFITKCRQLYLDMQAPSSKHNAWAKVGGYGRDIITWTNPEDIVLLLRNDVASFVDVKSLARAFNLDYAKFLASNVIYVDNFDQYDSEGTKVFDGSNIIGCIGDKSWFRIKEQEITMDEFYNANNRTWQYYLNVVKMYQYSLFSNMVVLATAQPQVSMTAFELSEDEVEVEAGETAKVKITTTPFQANYPTITVSSSASAVATASISGKEITITGVASGADADGTATITVTAGNLSDTISVTVPYHAS